IATNIGIHFFDMLMWVFGPVLEVEVQEMSPYKTRGFLRLERARVNWFLSIDYQDIPEAVRNQGKRTFRALTMENNEIEFSDGFTDLHIKSYQMVFEGKGFSLADAMPSINLVHKIRSSK